MNRGYIPQTLYYTHDSAFTFTISEFSKVIRKCKVLHLGSRKFLEFYKIPDCDSLIILPKKKLQIMVEDYVMDLKQRINPNSVPTYYFPIQSFLEANEIDLRWKKIKKLFPAKIKPSG